ncbi:MAG: IS1096 element passenger TnpR family protein [Flavobacteriaceae bacterium]
MYKVRVILDTKEDVIRTVLVNNAINLETLHFTIAKAFGFDGQEMASFYRTDDEWNQGEEIPLFNMAEAGMGISMATEILHQSLPEENHKLIYVYDFLHMWTFYVEVVEITNEKIIDSKVVLSVGEIPNEAPEKEFKAEDPEKELEDDEFDPFDDFDFNEY